MLLLRSINVIQNNIVKVLIKFIWPSFKSFIIISFQYEVQNVHNIFSYKGQGRKTAKSV